MRDYCCLSGTAMRKKVGSTWKKKRGEKKDLPVKKSPQDKVKFRRGEVTSEYLRRRESGPLCGKARGI